MKFGNLSRATRRAIASRKRQATTAKRMDKSARAAYCTGCGVTFEKRHLLINHRNSLRCGGRFLPDQERALLNRIRYMRESLLRQDRMFAKLEEL